MKKAAPLLAFAIVFLFIVQSAGTLVESIYVLDLMNTNLDAKVLGLLFFFSPILLIPFFQKYRSKLVWIIFAVLLIARGLFPYLATSNRMLASGIATGAGLGLFLLLLAAKPRGETGANVGLWSSAGMALTVGLSALLRTIYFGLDYSLTPAGGWSGILLGFMLGAALISLDVNAFQQKKKVNGVTPALIGFFLVLTLIYFAFSAPAVIARWTEGNYTLIVLAVSLLAIGWVLSMLLRPRLFLSLYRAGIILWNLAFTICLTATILVHGVAYPATPDSPAVIVRSPIWWQAIPLTLTLLLFPVLFLDLQRLIMKIRAAEPTPGQLVPGFMLGSLTMVLLVFFNIFSNVWGYVEPVSGFFRGKFWLSFLLPALGLCGLIWLLQHFPEEADTWLPGKFHWGYGLVLAGIFVGTFLRALPAKKVQASAANRSSITVMTYNIQAANDANAQKSFERQLALIRKVSPDILAMQETDTARISLNNNDTVRFYAESLGYYSYYGPSTAAGTFGTAILSKFPLMDTQSVFTYSDTDEIGVTEAVVDVAGLTIHLYDVHPDGSDTAKMAFAQGLVSRSKDQQYVIALGDYNLRDYEQPFQVIANVYTNAWTSVYPSKISPDGVDMSGDNRIDHIFLSPTLWALNPVYLLPPASATDHPVHWTEVTWQP